VWQELNCDTLLHQFSKLTAAYASDPAFLATQKARAVTELSALQSAAERQQKESNQFVELMHSMRSAQEQVAQCKAWVKEYGVTSIGDWSPLPAALRRAW
jgi:hypothetical protein